MDDITVAGLAEPIQPEVDAGPVYQVGKTENGKTTLRIGSSYSFSTVTMSNSGVRQMIRMLEAALEDEDEEAV